MYTKYRPLLCDSCCVPFVVVACCCLRSSASIPTSLPRPTRYARFSLVKHFAWYLFEICLENYVACTGIYIIIFSFSFFWPCLLRALQYIDRDLWSFARACATERLIVAIACAIHCLCDPLPHTLDRSKSEEKQKIWTKPRAPGSCVCWAFLVALFCCLCFRPCRTYRKEREGGLILIDYFGKLPPKWWKRPSKMNPETSSGIKYYF